MNAPPYSRLRARIALTTCLVLGLAALAWATFVSPLPRLSYNRSNSVAIGWYWVEPFGGWRGLAPRELSVESIVLISLPPEIAAFAARRGYLPSHIPLIKRVGAVSPQEVCIEKGIVGIDGVVVAVVLATDRLGRKLPSWQHCRRLASGELFLLSVTNPASFDSRYFGPIRASSVIGVAHPLWLERRS